MFFVLEEVALKKSVKTAAIVLISYLASSCKRERRAGPRRRAALDLAEHARERGLQVAVALLPLALLRPEHLPHVARVGAGQLSFNGRSL